MNECVGMVDTGGKRLMCSIELTLTAVAGGGGGRGVTTATAAVAGIPV